MIAPSEVEQMFGEVPALLEYHSQLLTGLRHAWELRTSAFKDSVDFSSVFLRFAPYLKLYRPYTSGFQSSMETLRRCLDDPGCGLGEFIARTEAQAAAGDSHSGGLASRGGLQSLMIRPVQRVPVRATVLRADHAYACPGCCTLMAF